MEILSFEELSVLKGNDKRMSVPYEEYFDVMNISEYQKDKRSEMANELELVILFALSLVLGYFEEESFIGDVDNIAESIGNRYNEALLKIGVNAPEGYVEAFSIQLVETTIEHIKEPYFRSVDRVMYTAENEANTIINHQEYTDATEQKKTKKVWLTEKDKFVRNTHKETDEITVPINEPFVVGNSLMMFPKDCSLGAEAKEIVNCRCTVKYF